MESKADLMPPSESTGPGKMSVVSPKMQRWQHPENR